MNKKFTLDLKTKVNNKQGSVLLTIIIFFMVIVVFLSSAALLAQQNLNKVLAENKYSSAYYVAESALNESIDVISSAISGISAEDKVKYVNKTLDIVVFLNSKLTAFDYGTINNDESEAIVSVAPLVDDPNYLVITSNGSVGNETRTLSRTILNVLDSMKPRNNTGTDFVVDAGLVVISNDTTANIAYGGGYKVNSPIITNKPTTISGWGNEFNKLFVTNNSITINSGVTFNAGIVTSSKLTVNSPGSNKFVSNAVVLKKGGEFIVNLNGWFDSGTMSGLKKIFIPAGGVFGDYIKLYKSNNVKCVKTAQPDYSNQECNNAFAYFESIVTNYTQLNFNPYDYPSIFGTYNVADGFDYRDYFKADFILDNPELLAKYNQYEPEIKLPAFPTTTQKLPASTINGYNVVDSSGNLSFSNSLANYWNNSQYTYVFPTGYTEAYIPKLTITDGRNHYIDVGDRKVSIVVDSLSISGNLVIKGTGSLSIYVRGQSMSSSNPNVVLRPLAVYHESKDPNKLNFFIAKTGSGNNETTLNVTSDGRTEVVANIFAENLSVRIENKFKGNIVSGGKSLYFSNSGASNIDSLLIYMPKASAYFDNDFKGSLVVKDIKYGSSGKSFTYVPIDKKNFPFEIESPIINGGSGGSNPGGGTGGTDPVDVGQIKFGPLIEGAK